MRKGSWEQSEPNDSWASRDGRVGCGWNSSPFTRIPKPFHHPMRAVSRIWVFLLQEQLLLKAKSDSTNFLSMRSGRRRVWHFLKKNGGVSLSLGNQYTFPDLRLPGPNWTAVNCPICCQDQPHGLQRILAKEGLPQGWGWVGRWRPKFRHPMGPGAAGDCPASWLHFESKAFHNPHPSCLKWTFSSSHLLLRGARVEEAALHGAEPA